MAGPGDKKPAAWPCPACTLLNDADARSCSICQEARPSGSIAGKAKGRMLRSSTPIAAAAAPHPIIASFGDSVRGVDNGEDDGENDDDFLLTASGAKKTSARDAGKGKQPRLKRTRGARRDPGGIDSADVGDGPTDRPVQPECESVVEASAAAVTASSTAEQVAVRSTRAPQQTQQEPVEVCDSDQSELEKGRPPAADAQGDPLDVEDDDEDNDNDNHDDDDDDASGWGGETPILLGRGWGSKERELAKKRKLAKERRLAKGLSATDTAAGSSRSGAAAAAGRHGKKRQRPALSFPGDDMFRARKYPAEGDGSGSGDGGGQRLAVRRKTRATEGERRRPFWRWPPPPPAPTAEEAAAAAAAAAADGESSVEDGGAAKRGQRAGGGGGGWGRGGGGRGGGGGGGAMESDSSLAAGRAVRRRDGTREGSSSDGGGRDGEARGRGEAIGDGAVDGLPSDALSMGTQGRKSRRKRSRLSLPPKRADDEREEEKSSATDGAPYDRSAAPDSPRKEIARTVEQGAEGAGGEERLTFPATVADGRPCRGDSGAAPAPVAESAASSGAAAEEGLPEDLRRVAGGDVAEGVGSSSDRGMRADEGGDVALSPEANAGARAGESRPENRPEICNASATAAAAVAPQGKGAGAAAPGLVNGSEDGGSAGGVGAPQAVSLNAGRPGAGAIAAAPALRMTMDLGDSDSDSSDCSSAHGDSGSRRGVAHLGRAMDEALKFAVEPPIAAAAGTAGAEDAATAAAPAAAPASPPQTSTDVLGSDDGESRTSLPAPWTPPPKRRTHEDKKATLEDSPNPSSMGLVDTPPQAASSGAREGRVSPPATRSGRKMSRANREVEMLAWSGSQSESPGLSGAGGRVEWACPKCTYANRARAKECEMCQSAKPSTPSLTRAANKRGGDNDVGDSGGGGSGGGGGMMDGRRRVGDIGGDRRGSASGSGLLDDSPMAGICGSSGRSAGEASDADRGGGGSGVGGDKSVDGWQTKGGTRSDAPGKEEQGTICGDGAAGGSVSGSTRAGSWRKGAGGGGEAEEEEGGNSQFGAPARREPEKAARGARYSVGDVEMCFSGEEEGDSEEDEEGDYDDDEDYQDEEDSEWEDPEAVGSQIEKMFMSSSQGAPQRSLRSAPLSPKRQHHNTPATDQVLDLTEAAEDEHEEGKESLRNGRGGSVGGAGTAVGTASDAGFSIEDISDDEDFSMKPDARGRGLGGARSLGGDREPPPPRKYPFFASVREHRDRGSSCVDYASLAAAPAGGPSGAKSYESRKRARDAKANKRGRKGKKPRASTAAGRGRGAGRGSAAARASTGAAGRGGRGSRSGVRPFGGTGGVPSASWVPAGVAARLSADAGRGRRVGGAAASRGGQRQPFNHYRGSDEMVDDSNGGGGLHWEHAGLSSFGD